MKRASSILLALCLILPLVSSAQTISNSQKRLINEEVLKIIDAYELNSSFSAEDDGTIYEFEHLFSDGATVVCDMMGTKSFLQQVSLKDYIQTVKDYVGEYGVYSSISDIKIASKDYSKGEIILTFRKHLFYSDKDNLNFDIGNYYGGDVLKASMKIVYSNRDQRCYIAHITGNLQSTKSFPKVPFYVIDNRNIIASKGNKGGDNLLSMIRQSNGKPLNLSDRIAIYSSDTEFYVDDFDVDLKLNKEWSTTKAYERVSFEMTRRALRSKFRIAFAPIAYSVQKPDYISASSMGFEFDVDFGKTISLGAKTKMGFYAGVGASFSNLSLSLDPTRVPDNNNGGLGNTENSMVRIDAAKEQVMFTDLYIPIYFEMEHLIGNSKNLVLTWNVGVNPTINIASKATIPYSVDLYHKDTVNHIYSHVYDITIDDYSEQDYSKSRFDLGVFGNIGIDYGIVPRKFYVTAQVGYEFGIFKAFESNTSHYLGDGNNPINVLKDQSPIKYEANYSLLDCVTVRRSALWISLGVKLKF